MVFVGAGVSMGAGYPSWKKLLKDIAAELGVDSEDVHDLAALAQWSIRKSGAKTRIRQLIRDEIGVDHPVPPVLDVLARLPVHYIWTTNYDRLIERAFASIGRPIDAISAAADIALKPRAGAVRLYKMHGTVDRLDDIVISTDDYELFRKSRGAFLPLLQAHLSSLSMLFVGLSFTDPNVRHVLSLIREAFSEGGPPEHFAIVRPPHRSEFDREDQFKARLAQHDLWADDLQRYGLLAIEIDSYDEVPDLLHDVERGLARQRVWVSGSWPIAGTDDVEREFVHDVASAVGRELGEKGLALVNGSGLIVGSAAVAGYLSALQRKGIWDLERRLIVRPFPQPLEGRMPDLAQWELLRSELGRLSGVVIFVGGRKIVDGRVVEADGVHAERKIADANKSFLLPIGATGGAAGTIANSLLGSSIPTSHRPTDRELTYLLDKTKTPDELAKTAVTIAQRVSSA